MQAFLRGPVTSTVTVSLSAPSPNRGERDAGDERGEEGAEGEEAGDPAALVAVEVVVAARVLFLGGLHI